MKIQFKPFYGVKSVTHVLSGSVWESDEIKDIADDQKIRVNINGESVYVSLIDDLLSNPDFVNADTGANDNFVCSQCGEHTTDESTFHPKSGDSVPLEIDGKKVCLSCFDSAEKTILPDSIEIKSEPVQPADDINEVN